MYSQFKYKARFWLLSDLTPSLTGKGQEDPGLKDQTQKDPDPKDHGPKDPQN